MSVHVAWQGWTLEIPSRWSPLKLEGDYDKGMALFADLHRPRLGLRWEKPRGKKFDALAWARRALNDEVGKLAADEARNFPLPDDRWTVSLLYQESEPPGRDVWVGYSAQSGRAVELIYHAKRRERILSTLIPTLGDAPADQPLPWSIFELSCHSPAGFALEKHVLNVGDQSLTFAPAQGRGRGRESVTVRQIGIAEVALSRMKLDQWLAQHQRSKKKYYRPVGEPAPRTLQFPVGELTGVERPLRRRRRFFLMRGIPKGYLTFAAHDAVRDKLLIVEATDGELLTEAAKSLGWAANDRRSRQD